ncbi:MAG: hypothetical protein GQ474_08475 [Sulfurimonas sp.]|nr:hypothetical protein [Sulfurimonas sp.]
MDKKNKILEEVNKHWQIIAFVIIFLGYITFSFYMNLNWFSFVEIDIKQIIGLGLLAGMFILWIVIASIKLTPILVKIIFALVPVFILNFLSMFNSFLIILGVILAVLIISALYIYIYSDKRRNLLNKERLDVKTKVKFTDLLFIGVSAIPIVIFFDWSFSLLFIVNIVFLITFQKYYVSHESFDGGVLIIFVLIIPCTLALIIDNVGLSVANFEKKSVTFKTNNRDINGTLVYKNTNSIFIHYLNKTIEVQRKDIESEIIYLKYNYKKWTLLNLGKEYYKFYTDRNITKPKN